CRFTRDHGRLQAGNDRALERGLVAKWLSSADGLETACKRWRVVSAGGIILSFEKDLGAHHQILPVFRGNRKAFKRHQGTRSQAARIGLPPLDVLQGVVGLDSHLRKTFPNGSI